MKKQLIIILTFCLSTVVFGQRNSKQEYWNTWRFVPKPDMVQKFESAVALKTKTFNSTPELGIFTYKVITGPNSGTYERIEESSRVQTVELTKESKQIKNPQTTTETVQLKQRFGTKMLQNTLQMNKVKNGGLASKMDRIILILKHQRLQNILRELYLI